MDRKVKQIIDKKQNSTKSAIEAFCAQCMGYWQDGKVDCESTKCPLYKWMPYGKLEPDFTWTEYNAKKVGKVKEEDIERRELTEEQKEASRKRLQKVRKDR
jgi:hypothetical protein